MSSCSFISVLALHQPLSTTISTNQKKHKIAIARSNGGGGGGGGSPLPPPNPCLTLQQSGNKAAGPVSLALLGDGGNGVGRRATIGLGVCLNAFIFYFFHLSAGETEAGAAAALAPAEEGQCSLTVAPSGLSFCDRLVGEGAAATKGQLIRAHYVGKLEDGKVFDSSYARGRPLTFRIGVGEVIKGWDQGILGGEGIPPMLSGGKRTLKIPPELAYGTRGAGCKGGSCIIPPDSTLFFDVEFIGKA